MANRWLRLAERMQGFMRWGSLDADRGLPLRGGAAVRVGSDDVVVPRCAMRENMTVRLVVGHREAVERAAVIKRGPRSRGMTQVICFSCIPSISKLPAPMSEDRTGDGMIRSKPP